MPRHKHDPRKVYTVVFYDDAGEVVLTAEVETARSIAHEITGGDEAAEALSYAMELSSDGQLPVTHYACCTAVSVPMLLNMQAVLGQGSLPGILFWRWNQTTELLVSTNCPESLSKIGELWSWEHSIQDAGLVRINISSIEG